MVKLKLEKTEAKKVFCGLAGPDPFRHVTQPARPIILRPLLFKMKRVNQTCPLIAFGEINTNNQIRGLQTRTCKGISNLEKIEEKRYAKFSFE